MRAKDRGQWIRVCWVGEVGCVVVVICVSCMCLWFISVSIMVVCVSWKYECNTLNHE
jgi:hypothetical protein